MKFCLTILHGQGLETKKALKATYNELVAKKASVKVALAAERASAEQLDDIASFWNEGRHITVVSGIHTLTSSIGCEFGNTCIAIYFC